MDDQPESTWSDLTDVLKQIYPVSLNVATLNWRRATVYHFLYTPGRQDRDLLSMVLKQLHPVECDASGFTGLERQLFLVMRKFEREWRCTMIPAATQRAAWPRKIA